MTSTVCLHRLNTTLFLCFCLTRWGLCLLSCFPRVSSRSCPAQQAGLACPLVCTGTSTAVNQHSQVHCAQAKETSAEGLQILCCGMWTLATPAAPAHGFTPSPCPPAPPAPSHNAGCVPHHPHGALWLPGWALWAHIRNSSGQNVLGWQGHVSETSKAGHFGLHDQPCPIQSSGPVSHQETPLATSQP